MEKTAYDEISEIFQKLNQSDKDHSQRIEKYWHDALSDNS
jgi:hypothetical protein